MSHPSSKLIQSLRQAISKQYPEALSGLEQQLNNIDKELSNLFEMQLQRIQLNDARIEELSGSVSRQSREIKNLNAKLASQLRSLKLNQKLLPNSCKN